MNPKQIADLYRTDMWGCWESDQIGARFELQEDYVLRTDFDSMTIPKGTVLIFQGMAINMYRFKPEPPLPRYGYEITLGRSRLLKMKLKKQEATA